MDCNRVFDLLTRAPFPTGTVYDALVEEHLRDCSGCHAFAEALRPCDGLAHEQLADAERRLLPSYGVSRRTAPVGQASYAERSGADRPLESAAPRRGPTSDGMARSWRSSLTSGYGGQQVASFALAPRAYHTWVWDLASLTTIALLIAFVGWVLGWLVF